MKGGLFPEPRLENFLLEIKYQGPSFDGKMEIGQLSRELAGLQSALKSIVYTLAKHKKINFTPADIEIFVEPFQKGSFRKIIKWAIKKVEKNPTTSLVVAQILVGVLNLIPQHRADQIILMTPELMTKIKDPVSIELLQNKQFINSVADIVRPLEQGNDEIIFRKPNNAESTISYKDRDEILKLAGEKQESLPEGDFFEILKGRINRVDLDAIKNNLGFKLNDEGTTIPVSFEKKPNSATMKDLLGRWVEIKGMVTVINGERSHVRISEYKTIIQPPLNFEGSNN